MSDFLQGLYKKKLFSLSDIKTEKTKAVAQSLQYYAQQGLVRQVRRNLYCMNDIASGNPLADRFEIGSRVSPSACIAYHSALEFHGLAHQTFYNCHVVSDSRFTGFSFDGYDFIFCRQTIGDAGVISPLGNPNVRVTDLERTVIDSADRIDRAGGIEELLHCLESVVMLDETKLAAYLAAYHKAFLCQKTGYLLERIKEQAHISDDFIEMCRAKGKGSVKQLTNNDESDTYVKQWNLYVPQSITSKPQPHELI